MQKKVCFAFDKAATNWKDEIVTRETKILLLEEVLNRHSETTSQSDDGMEVCTIDFSREAVYTSCKEMLPESAVDQFEDTDGNFSNIAIVRMVSLIFWYFRPRPNNVLLFIHPSQTKKWVRR